MAYEIITRSPNLSDFTALAEHEEQTPGTFFGGKPVLHLHLSDSIVRVASTDVNALPELATLKESDNLSTDLIELSPIDVWVTSRHLIIFSSTKNSGIQFPYPTISIHAQDHDAVLLELNLSDDNTPDEDLIFMQLRIVPSSSSPQPTPSNQSISTAPASSTTKPHLGNGTTHDPSTNPVRSLYDAISACQELNPDPISSDDDDDGTAYSFDESAPGASGWITSENMHEFVDEHGNFRMPANATVIGDDDDDDDVRQGNHEDGTSAVGSSVQQQPLGEGAGRRRGADEIEEANGGSDETKWQRTG